MATHKHVSSSPTADAAPATEGRTIRWAQHYDVVVRLLTLGKDKAIRQMTVDMAGIRPGDNVLDVGCGTGDLTLLAKARTGTGGKVVGIDAAPEMIEVARRKAAQKNTEVEFRTEVIEALSFPDQTFDVVLSSLMMHHLPGELKRRGLAEIFRVLKPGGRVLVIDMKSPAGHRGRHWMALMLHPTPQTGLLELSMLMKKLGFMHVEAGDTRFRALGFARGQAC